MKSISLGIASLSLIATAASATVRREGTWPERDPNVSLDLHQAPRHEAIRKLADAAGWSVVIDVPVASTTPIDIKLNDEEAGKALDVLLRDGNYVAGRDGKIVTIRAEVAAPQPPQVAPPPSPVPLGDVRVMGGSDRIEKGATVRDVKVVGGALEIFGTINGDLKVVGGSVKLRPGSHVKGDIKIVGGAVEADEGAIVDRHPKVLGGVYRSPGHLQIRGPSGGADEENDIHLESKSSNGTFKARVGRFGDSVMSIISGASILFLFGIVLLTLGKERAELMRLEIATRPMRSVALGVVGIPAAIVVATLLCVTVIGIPFALAGACLLGLGGVAALVSALQVLGELLVRHRTDNPYVHLGLGIALYAIAGSLPFIGSWVVLAAALISVGAFIATRAAGFIKKKAALPYRSPAEL
jgi:hypothetical protein